MLRPRLSRRPRSWWRPWPTSTRPPSSPASSSYTQAEFWGYIEDKNVLMPIWIGLLFWCQSGPCLKNWAKLLTDNFFNVVQHRDFTCIFIGFLLNLYLCKDRQNGPLVKICTKYTDLFCQRIRPNNADPTGSGSTTLKEGVMAGSGSYVS